MAGRIVFVGAGAVGSYVGGHLARAGNDVTLIDPWPEHIDRIKRHARRLVFQLAEVAVPRGVFWQVVQRIAELHPAPG